MRGRVAERSSVIALLIAASLGLTRPGFAQSVDSSLAGLRWNAAETRAGRFLIVPGERSMVAGYTTPGLEMWAYPLQLVRDYRVTFRVDGDSTETDGRVAMRTLEVTPTAVTRVYVGP